MKLSYKLTLLASAVVLVLVFGFYPFADHTQDPQSLDTQTPATEPTPLRRTLRSDTPAPGFPRSPGSPGDGSLASMVNPKPNGLAAKPVESDRTADLRARVQAARQAPSDPTDDLKLAPKTTVPPDPNDPGADALVAGNVTTRPDAAVNLTGVTHLTEPITLAVNADTKAQAVKTYTVKPGDTLSLISTRLYKTERRWVDIAQANPMVDPIKLKVGQVLKLPSDQALTHADEPVPTAPGNTVPYIIRPGDNLSTVAKQFYGDPTMWRYIFNANKDNIGDNPNEIRAGMTIKIPPAPKGAR